MNDSLDKMESQYASATELVGMEYQTSLVASFTSEETGESGTLEFRRFLVGDGDRVSYWHDVPLRASSGGMHAVIEIPRLTKAKMEIATEEHGTPIKQDTKKGRCKLQHTPTAH